MTQLPRAMTSPELVDIRKDEQFSSLYLWAYKPPTVYSARVNQTFSTIDKIVQITYDAGSGTLANVIPGMTMYVGSAAGLYDLGMVRIRKDPTSTIFYIGEESEIAWADDLYLTVIDFFGIWPRHLSLDVSNVAFMDYDIAYTDQHDLPNPVPCIGPRLIPTWLKAATVDVAFDGSPSWIPDGTALSFVWSCPGASATSGLTTATPTFTFDTAGTYRVKVVVTSYNGKTTTAYAYVRVFSKTDMPITQFDLRECNGSWQRGGWQTKLTLWAQADFSNVIDRSAAVLFARDFYGITEVSLSPVAGRENIIMEGWIDAENMVIDPDGASLDFTIEGTNAWLEKVTGFPVGIQNKTSVADAWTNWQNLTVDDSLFHLLYWQATAIPTIDVFPTNDTRISPEQSVPGEMSVWQQITYLITNTILARAISDRYSRLFAEIDTNLLPVSNRSTIPTVLTLTYKDWRDQAKITRYIVPPTSRIASSGVALALGAEAQALFSLSPGHVFKLYGKSLKQDRLLLSDQITANVLAGLILGRDNKLYDFEFDLAGNNPMVDICPRQYVGVNVMASDTPRGITFSGHMLVREIQVTLGDGNFLQTSWQGESESFPENSTNGDIPNSPALSPFPPFPKLPPLPALPPFGPTPPVPAAGPPNVVILTAAHGVWYTKDFNTDSPHWFSFNNGLDGSWFGDLWKVEVSMIPPHRCFLYVARSDANNGGIYTADYPGAKWRRIITAANINSLAGWTTDNLYLTGFGLNRNTEDELMVMGGAGTGPGVGSNAHWGLFNADKSGVIAFAGQLSFNTRPTGNPEDIVYGAGKWVYDRHAAGSLDWLLGRASRSGGTFEITEILRSTANKEDSVLMRCALDTPRVVWLGASATYGMSADNFATYAGLPNPPAYFGMGGIGQPVIDRYELLGMSPSGQNIIASDSSGFPKRSNDFGTTFGGGIGLTGVLHAVWNCGDENSFIVSIVGQIQFSPDLGATFYNRTGDLQGWTSALVNIMAIRSFMV